MTPLKKVILLMALALCGGLASAQVAESPDWATKIKAEGLGRSQVEELALEQIRSSDAEHKDLFLMAIQ